MSRPPNLLFLYTDQQCADTLASYGGREDITFNLNKLAQSSVVFERAYVTQPICTPSRSSLLTGLYPHTNGCIRNNIPLPKDVKCFPEMLTKGKWLCAHYGKWHLGDEIYPQHGFVEWHATEDTYHEFYSVPDKYKDRSSYHHWLVAQDIEPFDWTKKTEKDELIQKPWLVNRFFREQICSLPERFSRPFFLAQKTIEFIKRNRNDPFVLFVNFLEPHPPYSSCRNNQYTPDDVKLPDNHLNFPAESTPLVKLEKLKHVMNRSEIEWRNLIARYLGMCSLVDTYIGKILASLEEEGLFDDTIIVFTSDHGDMMGSHGLLGKSVMYEEAVRVPLLLKLPHQREKIRIKQPVSHIDLVPTLLEFMGEELPSFLQGRSLKEVIFGNTTPGRDVVIEWPAGPGEEEVRTVISSKYKLNISNNDKYELFDLIEDPLETSNIIRINEYQHVIYDLCKSLERWQKDTDDTFCFKINTCMIR